MDSKVYKSVAVKRADHDELRRLAFELNLPITQVVNLLLFTYRRKEDEIAKKRKRGTDTNP